MVFRKADLEAKFGVPVYTGWHLVPIHLHARNFYKKVKGVIIPEDAEPDAIKGGGAITKSKFYLLFDEHKHLPESEWSKQVEVEVKQERPKLKVNYEN